MNRIDQVEIDILTTTAHVVGCCGITQWRTQVGDDEWIIEDRSVLLAIEESFTLGPTLSNPARYRRNAVVLRDRIQSALEDDGAPEHVVHTIHLAHCLCFGGTCISRAVTA